MIINTASKVVSSVDELKSFKDTATKSIAELTKLYTEIDKNIVDIDINIDRHDAIFNVQKEFNATAISIVENIQQQISITNSLNSYMNNKLMKYIKLLIGVSISSGILSLIALLFIIFGG